MAINEDNFVKELLKSVPEFKEVHKNEKDYHEIGIHLVLGDLKRFAEKTYMERQKNQEKEVLDFILKCLKEGNENVKNAVFVSFFENMDDKCAKNLANQLPEKFRKDVLDFLECL